jgi:hypothetical protein
VKIIRNMCIMAIVLAAAGCASANMASLRDPAYAHRDFSKVAVFAVGLYLDNPLAVENQVCDKLAPAQCVPGKRLLPSRTYSPDQIARSLSQAKVDGVVIMMLGDDQTSSAFLASIASDSSSSSSAKSGTPSLYGNLADWDQLAPATTTERDRRLPIYNYGRAAHAIAGLFDRSSGKTAWGGQLNVSAQGEASISDKDFIGAATSELATQLRHNNLIKVPIASPSGR